MQNQLANPLWDEAIASFLLGEYDKCQKSLTIDDLQGFALDKAVRIGDLLETLFLMAIYGDWTYSDSNGVTQELDEAALDELYAKGRLQPEDLKAFSGVWTPVN